MDLKLLMPVIVVLPGIAAVVLAPAIAKPDEAYPTMMRLLPSGLLGLVFAANIQSIQEFVSWMLNRQLWDPTLRFLSQIPSEIDPGEVVAVTGMAIVLSLLATLYPSFRAARLDPVQALRYG